LLKFKLSCPLFYDTLTFFNTGLQYYQGNEVKQDYSETMKWMMKAAIQNHSTAQLKVGISVL